MHIALGEYAFYYFPTNNSYGIRFKKYTTTTENDNSGGGDGDENNNNNGRPDPTREATFLKKYIYLKSLGNPFNNINSINYNPMRPTIIDFYSKSKFYLGRLEYDETNI